MFRRQKRRPLPELRTVRRTIATQQEALEQLGRRDIPDPDADRPATTQWRTEFVATRQARDRALEAYLTIHALLALERVRGDRDSRSRLDSWRERLLALGERFSDDAAERDGTSVAGKVRTIVGSEHRLFRKRLDALPGDRSSLVRAVATELVERDLSDDDRTILAAVLGIPARVMETACGHCVQRFLGGSGVTDPSTADGIRVCPACEFAMPAPERRCASCGRERSEPDP